MYGWNGRIDIRTNKYLVSQAYKEATKEITLSLSYLNRCLKRLTDKQIIIRDAGRRVKEFMNLSTLSWHSRSGVKETDIQIGRMILSKYILDQNLDGVDSRHLANYFNPLDKCDPENPRYWRDKFNQKIEADTYYKKLWGNFNTFINNFNQ